MPKEVATQTGAAEGEIKALTPEEIQSAQENAFAARNDATAAIAARRNAAFAAELGEQAAPESDATSEPAPKAELDAATQVDKQATDDGEMVLDLDQLKRIKIRTKVDGNEELVSGDKVLSRYQKDAAADVRLARAVETEKQAQAKLAEAQKKLDEAGTVSERKAAEKDIAAASEELNKLTKDFAAALYEGDQEKAADLFKQAINTATKTSAQPARSDAATPDVEAIVRRTAAEVKQQLSVDSALDKLFTDYPEIKNDPDFATLADRAVDRLVADGRQMAEAIIEAGEELGKKFKLGKHANPAPKDEGRPANSGPTTRDGKKAAKEGIDEISGTGARSTSYEPTPQTRSQTIAEMAAARGAGRPL